MMKIIEIWDALEADWTFDTGLLLRRYSAQILPDVYVALSQTEGKRSLAIKLEANQAVNLSRYSNLRDITVTVTADRKEKNLNYLMITLATSEHHDVFATLCEDLIKGIESLPDEEKLVKELLNRFEKWKSLFERSFSEGLSPEEQRGLYGELYFLRSWLRISEDYCHCIEAWTGPELELRDFQIGSVGIEVKSTQGNNHQKIHISNERQLDTSKLEKLILCHISLESQNENGENLNGIVESILQLLSVDSLAYSHLKTKLLHAGYFAHHSPLYDKRGYQIRTNNYYNVRENFPRIEESNLPPGVGDVKYTIIVSDYSHLIIPETTVFNLISKNGNRP
ncbi:PD-(D/E)XK motif protein [Flavitalea antarctica]